MTPLSNPLQEGVNSIPEQSRVRFLFLRLALALIIAAALYLAADRWMMSVWNNQLRGVSDSLGAESLIVRVLEAGPEEPVPVPGRAEPPEGEKIPPEFQAGHFPMLQRSLRILLLTGEQQGITADITAVRLVGSGVEPIPGRRYLLVSDVFEDGTVQYSIADAYRIPSLVAFIAAVGLLLVACTGWRGFWALLGLAASIAVLLGVMIPLVARGWPPVPVALASVLILSTVTVFCVVRRPHRRSSALLGSLGGVGCGFLFGVLMVRLWQLTGLAGEGSALLASTLPGIDMQGILLSAVLVGAIGAVLDVGISVTASLAELVDYDPDIPLGRLWQAGVNVGSEVLGSMINTLILAYLGSSLPMAVLISSAGVNMLGLLNDPYIGQEIVQSLAGTTGLLLTIPITAFVFVAQEAWARRGRGGAA
ncbi:MAG: YibE/F family protein [Fretibacterium sp.]|nr:YibE/F family protein [Fretibacterium sp.]